MERPTASYPQTSNGHARKQDTDPSSLLERLRRWLPFPWDPSRPHPDKGRRLLEAYRDLGLAEDTVWGLSGFNLALIGGGRALSFGPGWPLSLPSTPHLHGVRLGLLTGIWGRGSLPFPWLGLALALPLGRVIGLAIYRIGPLGLGTALRAFFLRIVPENAPDAPHRPLGAVGFCLDLPVLPNLLILGMVAYGLLSRPPQPFNGEPLPSLPPSFAPASPAEAFWKTTFPCLLILAPTAGILIYQMFLARLPDTASHRLRQALRGGFLTGIPLLAFTILVLTIRLLRGSEGAWSPFDFAVVLLLCVLPVQALAAWLIYLSLAHREWMHRRLARRIEGPPPPAG